MTPPPPPIGAPAFEGAIADGHSVALPDAISLQSPLERLLARGRLRATVAMLGPAFVAAVAYVDPGNFATNIQGGARFGYGLLWVVLLANAMAMLVQFLSAKLGIVTDRSLPELCRERFPRWTAWALWVQAEVMAMSTDIAEFLGAALGLNLLFGVPLLPAGLITGVIAFGILELQTRGFRKFELAITGKHDAAHGLFLEKPLRLASCRDASMKPSGADVLTGPPHLVPSFPERDRAELIQSASSSGRRFLRRPHRRLKLQQVDFRQHGRAPWCALTVSGQGGAFGSLARMPYALALAPPAESSPGSKIFFLQKRLSYKGYPLYGQNHFWTGSWERGHD